MSHSVWLSFAKENHAVLVEHLCIYFSIYLFMGWGRGKETWLEVIMMFYLILVTSYPYSELCVLPGPLHKGT